VNDIAVVAGYPAYTYVKESEAQKRSENFMYSDFGHIEVDLV